MRGDTTTTGEAGAVFVAFYIQAVMGFIIPDEVSV